MDSLAIFSKAAVMLAEANTIQKAKELKSIALTAAEWATRKKAGKEAVSYCYLYARLAEFKMGKMLMRDGFRRKLGERRPHSRCTEPGHLLPSLKDLGITRNEASQAMFVAELPQTLVETWANGAVTLSKLKRTLRANGEAKHQAIVAAQMAAERKESIESICEVRHCSCTELFASGIRPDAIITDPPYPREFLQVFDDLALAAKAVPLVAVMVGQAHLPEVIRRLTQHLKYRWTMAYLTPGGQSSQQFIPQVNTFWKPVLLFGNSDGWIGDVCRSDTNDNDKQHHHWGQSESGMADLVERLTRPGQLVCDPFLGGGTTGVVSLSLDRRFIGCDIDKDAIEKSRIRLGLSK